MKKIEQNEMKIGRMYALHQFNDLKDRNNGEQWLYFVYCGMEIEDSWSSTEKFKMLIIKQIIISHIRGGSWWINFREEKRKYAFFLSLDNQGDLYEVV